MMKEAWTDSQRIRNNLTQASHYSSYANDPVGFGTKVLGEHFTDDVIRVMESVRDYPVTIAKSATGVGKSHGAARIAIWFYKVFSDSQVYLAAAPPVDNLRKILWGEVLSVVDKNKALFYSDIVRTNGIYAIPPGGTPTSSKHFISCVTIPTAGTPETREAKFSGKHAPHLLFIVDEGDAVPEEIYKGIEGCMSGGLVYRLLIMFNPRITSGIIYDKEINRKANVVQLSAFTHPNVTTGKNVIPGAVNRDVVGRRINEWSRPLMPQEIEGSDCFEVPDFMVGTEAVGLDGRAYPAIPSGIRKVTEAPFFYMVLGKYPPTGESQLISPEWVDAAVSRWQAYVARVGEIPPAEVAPIMGVDVAELGGDWNVACLRYGAYVAKLIPWQGMDSDQTARHAYSLHLKHGVDLSMIDGMGIGSSVAPSMARMGRMNNLDVRAVSVKVSERPNRSIVTEVGEFKSIRDQLWWAVRDWLMNDKEAMLPPDRMLKEELTAPFYEVPDGKIKITSKDKLRDKLRRSPDRADALCLTFYPIRRAKTVVYSYQRGGDSR